MNSFTSFINELWYRLRLGGRGFWCAVKYGKLPLDVAMVPYIHPGASQDLWTVYWHYRKHIILVYTGPGSKTMHQLFQSSVKRDGVTGAGLYQSGRLIQFRGDWTEKVTALLAYPSKAIQES